MKRAILFLLIAMFSLSACGKKDGDGGDGKGKKGSKKKALKDLNKFKIKSIGGQNNKLFDGDMTFKNALITGKDGEGNMSLWMWTEGGTCDEIKGKATKAPKTRVMVNFGKVDAAVQKGEKASPKEFKIKQAVILHKGFNRVLMSFKGPIGKATVHSGKLKEGGEVTGTVTIENKWGDIKGNFKAKVCP